MSTSIAILKGQSASIQMQAVDAQGAPITDWTGKEIQFEVKKLLGDPDPSLIFKSSSGMGAPIALTDGTITIAFTPSDTLPLTSGDYYYDLWLIQGSDRYPLQDPAKFRVGGVVNITGGTPAPSTPSYIFTDATRPAASTFPVGQHIYNSDDKADNVSDGTNWRDTLGDLT